MGGKSGRIRKRKFKKKEERGWGGYNMVVRLLLTRRKIVHEPGPHHVPFRRAMVISQAPCAYKDLLRRQLKDERYYKKVIEIELEQAATVKGVSRARTRVRYCYYRRGSGCHQEWRSVRTYAVDDRADRFSDRARVEHYCCLC